MQTEVDPTDPRLADKRDALAFLIALQRSLERSVPPASEMYGLIRRIAKSAKTSNSQLQLKLPESAFLNTFVIPELAKIVAVQLGREQACNALLVEYYRRMPSVSYGAPGHTAGHPFTKVLGLKLEKIYEKWTDTKKAMIKSWPDFTLRKPFPHKIVFEGKYFSEGFAASARRALVTNIYEAFFYRALPFIEQTKKGRAAWDYDYACLLAYDASRDGALRRAWNDLPKSVQHGFWDSANIYVMILGGQGRPAK